MKAHIHVLTAKGHGPNALFPHELAWIELSSANSKVETSKRAASASNKPLWDETIELDIGDDEKEIMIHMRGKFPAHDGVDEIGSGTYQIENKTENVVKVPLFTSNGKEAGVVEMEIEFKP